ncbi:MAG: hypothetical protein GY788_23675 [bacterium]|nr:hypothetical protein [bacterium]
MTTADEHLSLCDAARLALHANLLGDLDKALSLIGLERVAGQREMDLLESTVAADEPKADDEAVESDDSVDDEEGRRQIARLAHTLAAEWQRDGPPDQADGGRRATPRTDKSMIAYLLVPDNPSPNELSFMERYDFTSVPDVIRAPVEQESATTRRDNWRLTLRVRDHAPRYKRPRGVDLRSAVTKVARLEPLEAVPALMHEAPMALGSILVDHSLLVGPFRADIDSFLRSLANPTDYSIDRYMVQMAGGVWHWTDGPMWRLTPIDFDLLSYSSLAIFPGWRDPAEHEDWQRLTEQARGFGKKVSVILVGGDGGLEVADPLVGVLAEDR